MREHAVEAAVVGDELDGGLFAHTRHARNIVGRIAHEAFDIDHAARHNAVAL
ncbi:hypothetical protein SDC9_120542 [bioreactor metagenome]|uniref:Uncharacterized protein n=1 Tax=bioreactor metagenome TaxID=1076179 RepID=A0A645C740_9ZZZZ